MRETPEEQQRRLIGDVYHPSQLMADRLKAEQDGESLAGFLERFDFQSRDEIVQMVRRLAQHATEDPYFHAKENRSLHPSVDILYRRALKLRASAGALDKYADSVASELWAGKIAPRIRDAKVRAMFSTPPDPDCWEAVADKIQWTYNFSRMEVQRLRFFVCMVKMGEDFPCSLRRMLYMWGDKKKTGKTTTARMLAAVLNGEEDWQHTNFATTLQREMQIENYAVPLVAECRCAVLDEAMFADMSRVYHRLKTHMTSTDGTARLPYGQTFAWHGLPNYIATSNEPLSHFIEDWNDRRYLCVEFANEPKQLKFDEIWQMWREFAIHSYLPDGKTIEEWGDEMMETSNEVGVRTEYADEYAELFRSSEWVEAFNTLPTAPSAWHNDNRLTLGKIVKMVCTTWQDNSHRRHRGEIERAFIEVFGPRAKDSNFWLISDCRKKIAAEQEKVRERLQAEDQRSSAAGSPATARPFAAIKGWATPSAPMTESDKDEDPFA